MICQRLATNNMSLKNGLQARVHHAVPPGVYDFVIIEINANPSLRQIAVFCTHTVHHHGQSLPILPLRPVFFYVYLHHSINLPSAVLH